MLSSRIHFFIGETFTESQRQYGYWPQSIEQWLLALTFAYPFESLEKAMKSHPRKMHKCAILHTFISVFRGEVGGIGLLTVDLELLGESAV